MDFLEKNKTESILKNQEIYKESDSENIQRSFQTDEIVQNNMALQKSPLNKIALETVVQNMEFAGKGIYANLAKEDEFEYGKLGIRKDKNISVLMRANSVSVSKNILAETLKEYSSVNEKRKKLKEEQFGVSSISTTDERKVKDQMKRFAVTFNSWKKTLNEDSNICRQIKDIRLLRIASTYKGVISEYEKIRDASSESQVIKDFFDTYRELVGVKESLKNPGLESSTRYSKVEVDEYKAYLKLNERISERTGINIESETGYKEEEKTDLSKVQQKAVENIDQWIVRNAKNANMAFINKVIELPAKKRLLIYYAIQHSVGYAITTDELTVAREYTPDLTVIKDKMIASKMKFWKRFSGSHFYWHKLQKAYASVIGLNEEAINQKEDEKEADQLINETRQQVNVLSEMEQPDESIKKALEFKKAQLNQMEVVSVTKALLQTQQDLLLKKENGVNVEEDLSANEKLLAEAFEQMQLSAQNLTNLTTELQGLTAEQKVGIIKELVGTTQIGALGAGLGTAAVADNIAATGQAMAVADSMEAFQKLSQELDSSIGELKQLMKANVAFGTLGAVGALLGVVGGIMNLAGGFNALTVMDKVDVGLGMIGNAHGVARSITSVISSVLAAQKPLDDFKNGITTSLEASTTSTTKILGFVGLGIQGAVGISQSVRAGLRSREIKKAVQGFKAVDDKFSEKKTDTLEERMVRLSKRNNKNLKNGAVSAFIGAGLTAFTLGTAGIGLLAAALIALTVGVTSAGLNQGMHTSITNATIDDFLGLESIVKEQYEAELSVYDKDSPEYKQKGDELMANLHQRKDALRKEIIGQMGYASEKEFLHKVISVQGSQLLNKIFMDENGRFISKDDPMYESHRAKAEPYIKLVQSFGCRVRFGKKIEDCKPSIETLIGKMHG